LLEIDLKYVDHFLAYESVLRCERIGLQYLIDFRAHLRRVSLCIGRPLRSDAIKLVLRIVECNVRIETGSRGSNHVAGNISKVGIRMVLSPHAKRIDCTSEPLATGSIAVALFPPGNCVVTADGNLPGYSLEKFSKNMSGPLTILPLAVNGKKVCPITHTASG